MTIVLRSDHMAAAQLLAERPVWLFDLDGTLIDSLTELKGVYVSFITELGWQPSDQEFNDMNGPTIPEIVKRLACRRGYKGPIEPLVDRYLHLIEARVSGRAPAMSGAEELLAAGRMAGHRLALVTSSLRSTVEKTLYRLKWHKQFDAVTCGDDVLCAKPAPDLYLRAMYLLDCTAGDCVAMEDSANGLAAARAAGADVIHVGGSNRAQGGLGLLCLKGALCINLRRSI